MFVVDASVWVSRFIAADVHHAPSRFWISARLRSAEPLVAPVMALAEVSGAISRRSGDPGLGERAVSLMHASPTVHLVPVEFGFAREGATIAADLRLRGADALYVALARRLGVPLVTWDQEQKQRGSHIIAVLTPQEDTTKR